MMPNRMTGTLPFLIVFGQAPCIPLEEAFDLPMSTEIFEEEKLEKVIGRLDEYKEGMKERFDENVTEARFYIGQKVL